MARRNPTMSKSAVSLEPPIRGIDNLENPIGVNMKALEDSEAFPGHSAIAGKMSYTPNNGDQKDVASPPFANSKDIRHFEKQGGADPTPAMPGA